MDSVTPPLHDLVIRTIAEFLPDDNITLAMLQRLNRRFYSLRDIFIEQLVLYYVLSTYATRHKPYGWNKVRSLRLGYGEDIPDLSAINNVFSVVIEGTQIDDLSALAGGKLRYITLNCCNNILDVSPLSGFHSVSLSSCYHIYDVSPLRNVHSLSFSFMNIRDISSLKGGRLYSICLHMCSEITDVSALKDVHTVTLALCASITDVSALKKVPKLTISGCYNIVKN